MTSDSSRKGALVGAGGGVVAFLVGYVFTYALSNGVVRDLPIGQMAEVFSEDGVVWKTVGWVFFNAHLATTTVDVDVAFLRGTEVVNWIVRADGLSALLYVIPPALLLAAGLAAARVAGTTTVGSALRVGPAVALGYLPSVVAGVFLFTVTVGESTGQPTLVTAVGLAGVVYPVLFGTLGAAIGALTADRPTGRGAAA